MASVNFTKPRQHCTKPKITLKIRFLFGSLGFVLCKSSIFLSDIGIILFWLGLILFWLGFIFIMLGFIYVMLGKYLNIQPIFGIHLALSKNMGKLQFL